MAENNFNINTLLSAFNDKGTLLKWLKKIEKKGTLTTLQFLSAGVNLYKLRATFGDESYVDSNTFAVGGGTPSGVYPVLTGAAAPTTATVGAIGQHYVKTASPQHEYVCIQIVANEYVWLQLAAYADLSTYATIAYVDESVTGLATMDEVEDAIDDRVPAPVGADLGKFLKAGSTGAMWVDIPVSGNNDGTNWTDLTIKGVTKNIPSGGGGLPVLSGAYDPTTLTAAQQGQLYVNTTDKTIFACTDPTTGATQWKKVTQVSGTNDGTNWTALTIDGVQKAIPQGGGGGGTSLYQHNIIMYGGTQGQAGYYIIILTLILTRSTPFTVRSELITLLKNGYISEYNELYSPIGGFYASSSSSYQPISYITITDNNNIRIVNYTLGHEVSGSTIIDVVKQIS